MNVIERVMRVMTHVNIGATLGLAAWLLWSGWQVVTGQMAPAYSPAEVKALMSLAHAGHPAPKQLVSDASDGETPPPCHPEAPAPKPSALALAGGAS